MSHSPLRGPLAWMARNSVAANLLMVVIIVGGLLTLSRTKQEVFPSFELDVVAVTVVYPGASPSEVEQGIVLSVEEAVRGVDGVKRVTSTSTEGSGTVSAQLLLDADPDNVLADIKSEVGRIRSFPKEAEEPDIRIISLKQRVISLVLAGDLPVPVLEELSEQARDLLLASPKITDVSVEGIPAREIAVEIPPEVLEEYDLDLGTVAAQIRRSSLQLPGGTVDTRSGELLLRVDDRRRQGAEFEDIVLRGLPGGGTVRLGDVANIRDGYAETDQWSFFDGKPAVRVTAYRVGSETPKSVATAAKEIKEKLDAELPEAVTVDIWNDQSLWLEGRIDLLVRNAAQGGLLVLCVLALFLNIRLAFWVSLGIPISFAGAFLLMPQLDLTVNMISLFALIIVLGMVVDDAIIVGEAGYSRMREGKSRLQAAVEGASEVITPVTFAILTTIAAFAPLLFIPGLFGKFFRIIPLMVIAVLIFSLIESFLILPAHLAHIGKPGGWTAPIDRVQGRVAEALERFIETVYRPVVRRVIAWRYVALAVALCSLLFGVGLVRSGMVPFSFFPLLEGDVVTATVRYPFGTNIERTQAAGAKLEDSVVRNLKDFGEEYAFGRFLNVGQPREIRGPSPTLERAGSHIVTLEVNLVPGEERTFTAAQFKEAWRDLAGEFPGAESVIFSSEAGPSAGAALAVQLSHRDQGMLQAASSDLEERLGSFSDLTNIENAFSSGKVQLEFELDEDRAGPLGLTTEMVASQVRGAFYGAEALREQRGRHEVRVMVRYPEEHRQSERDIQRFLLRTPSGAHVPLGEVATFERGRAPTAIDREDGKRVVTVSGGLAQGVRSPEQVIGAVTSTVIPDLVERYPGLSAGLVGEQREQGEVFASLGPNFILALFVIFSLLAVPLGSYLQPVVIMSAIPFGFVGAVLGHLIMGYELSFVSAMGIIALSGVVVNDSLVLVDTSNRYRRGGKAPLEAVIDGGARRLRPIVLTSLTTFFGLLPMIFEDSVQARFLIPMALSLGFGVIFATFIILLLVPAVYMMVEDARGLFGIRSDDPELEDQDPGTSSKLDEDAAATLV